MSCVNESHKTICFLTVKNCVLQIKLSSIRNKNAQIYIKKTEILIMNKVSRPLNSYT